MLVNTISVVLCWVSRAVFNMLVRNASPRGPICFRCLIFSLSGPCELLFLLCFIASWTELLSVMLYPCILCVALLMDYTLLCGKETLIAINSVTFGREEAIVNALIMVKTIKMVMTNTF